MIYVHTKHLLQLLSKNTDKIKVTKHTKAKQKLFKERKQIIRELTMFRLLQNSTYGRLRNDANN